MIPVLRSLLSKLEIFSFFLFSHPLAELAEDPSHVQRILLAAGIKNLEASSE